MARLKDLTNAAIRALTGYQNLNVPVLAINGAGAASVKTTSAATVMLGGLVKSITALAAQSIAPTIGPMAGAGPFAQPAGNAALNLGAYPQPAGTTVYYTIGADYNGNIIVVQGTYVGQNLVPANPSSGLGASMAGVSFVGDGSVPDCPGGISPYALPVAADGVTALSAITNTKFFQGTKNVPTGWTPFGLIKITTNASTTFTPGTTALDAAGITPVFYDISMLPEVAP